MRHPSRRDIISGAALLIAAAFVTTPSGLLAQEPIPLAIRGYDPVAYFMQGKPVQGRADIAYDWDEQRYYFASPEHREMFKSDPVHYAPQFANFCAMALARAEKFEVNPEYWLVDDDKLYLFSLAAGPARFGENLKANAAKAQQNRWLISK
jgi:YHS domain-containing protein